jgi:hypothetical protein
VDSGAVYSFVPRDILVRLGIAPHSRLRFRLADGSTIERDRGDALFFYKNQQGAAPVIFGEREDATLLGAVTLESLGFVLDAVRRDLMPLRPLGPLPVRYLPAFLPTWPIAVDSVALVRQHARMPRSIKRLWC